MKPIDLTMTTLKNVNPARVLGISKHLLTSEPSKDSYVDDTSNKKYVLTKRTNH